jgi:cyclophilin family peptidyl-prolyl cis-trans isomerase
MDSFKCACVEMLESRTMLSSGPVVTGVLADDRGQATLTFKGALDPSTVNSSTVLEYTAGPDGLLNTADDTAIPVAIQYGGGTLYVTGNVPVGQRYRVVLVSGGVTGTNHKALVGNMGHAGHAGNFDVETGAINNLVRFSTVAGAIDVALTSNTPLTKANFQSYADLGAYDNSIIHQNPTSPQGAKAHLFLQGGGYRVNGSDQYDLVTQKAKVKNEFSTSNTLGTLAMAKLLPGQDTDPVNSATNQWFFNLRDNRKNFDKQNGGYTVFGYITSKAGLAVMNALDKYPVINGSNGLLNATNESAAARSDTQHRLPSAFSELPVLDTAPINQSGTLDPMRDSVLIFRVGMLVTTLPTRLAMK